MERQEYCGKGVKCRFWERKENQGIVYGECRRRAPVFFRTADGDDDCGWPRALAEEWCGEHKEAMAPAVAPDEQQRCGTCLRYEPSEEGEEGARGRCTLFDGRAVYPDERKDCGCWNRGE